MSVVGAAQVPIEVIGGLVTNFDPQTLPPGVSPDCPDTAFRPGIPGTVKTRPGTSTVATPVAGSKYTYLKTFIDQQGNIRNLYLSDQGILVQEYPQGTFTQVNMAPNSSFLSLGMQAKSDTAFGREFIGFSDGLHGINIPRQWNGENFDRVTQCGPGAGPITAQDYNVVMLTTLSRTANIISGTTSAPHLLTIGSLVNIVGVTADGTLNGQFPVISTPTATTFTAWGNPGTYAITNMVRAGGTVTAVITPTPSFVAGAQIVVANAGDPSFNGLFAATTVNGNIVTWPQGGLNKTTVGGTLYTNTPKFTIVWFTGQGSGTSLYAVYFFLYGDQIQPFTAGADAIIAGQSDPSLDGTFTITGVAPANLPNTPAGATSWVFSYLAATFAGPPPWGTATPSLPDSNPVPVQGVAGPAGNISFGEHQIAVSFVMRSGYITQPSPAIPYVSLGGFQLQLLGIPTGSPDGSVVGRIVMATASGLENFFYSEDVGDDITAMQINDNVTTTLLVDFTDAALLGSVSADYLFDLLELGEVAGFAQYGNILTAWGERNWQKNWQNLSFDGGFNGAGTPLGWNQIDAGGMPGLSPVWGQMYSITGDGVSVRRGTINQPAVQDQFQVNRISPATAYSVRVLLRINLASLPVTQGIASIHLVSGTLGLDAGLDIPYSQLSGTFVEFIGPLCSATAIPIIPQDLLLTLGTTGTLTNGGIIDFENVEIFPTEQPYNDDILYGSYVEEPENFDGVLGIQTISAGDGKRIVTTFQIRTRLYILKNGGGLYTETADAASAFSEWAVDPVDDSVGCESINGIGTATNSEGESWVFILDKKGLYIFWSDTPVKISQEIQTPNGVSAFHWDAINWNAITTAWIVTDSANRRVLIGLPMGNSATPNLIAQMDYNLAGATAQEIVDSPPVSPTFTGQLKSHMRSRKWSPWNISSSGAGLVLRSDGTYHLFLGNGIANGQIYDLLDTNLSDVEGPINAYYTTNYYPSDEQKQQILQSKGNIVLLRYLSLQILGQGTLSVTAYGPNRTRSYSAPVVGAPAITLEAAPAGDVETFMNFSSERMSLKIQAVQSGGTMPWFSLQNGLMYVAQDPVSAIRGWNNYDPTQIVPV